MLIPEVNDRYERPDVHVRKTCATSLIPSWRIAMRTLKISSRHPCKLNPLFVPASHPPLCLPFCYQAAEEIRLVNRHLLRAREAPVPADQAAAVVPAAMEAQAGREAVLVPNRARALRCLLVKVPV